MKKFWTYLGAILIGGLFVWIGYRIFSGNPFTEHTITYGGIDPINVQDWLIAKLGQSGAGVALMAFGAVAAIMAVRSGSTKAE